MRDPALDLSAIDRDGAVREAASAIAEDDALREAAAAGDTRAGLLRKAVLGGGALMGGGLLLGGLAGAAAGADTRSARQDRTILNFALTLEYLEAEFYAQAVAADGLSGDTRAFATIVAAHEAAHVAYLRSTLGSRAVAKPTFDFAGIPASPVRFRETAVQLEDAGVAAYVGQSYRLRDTSYILVTARILAVEARHAAWARQLVGRNPSDAGEALNGRARMGDVEKVIADTGFITP